VIDSNSQTITYYFSTRFNFPGTNLAGVSLQATNYIDDGCVIDRADPNAMPNDWTTIKTNQPSVSTISLADTQATNLNWRFYRVQEKP
jgi:hypothetical protein